MSPAANRGLQQTTTAAPGAAAFAYGGMGEPGPLVLDQAMPAATAVGAAVPAASGASAEQT